MALITFYTPHLTSRPRNLAACRASLDKQTDQDFEQVVIEDAVGIGIPRVLEAIRYNLDKINGQYVYVLQDDDRIVNPHFISDFRLLAQKYDAPPVVIGKSRKYKLHLPLNWRGAPGLSQIDLGNYIVRADVFKANAHRFGVRYQGDYDFIRALWDLGYEFSWWDYMIAESDQFGQGRGE